MIFVQFCHVLTKFNVCLGKLTVIFCLPVGRYLLMESNIVAWAKSYICVDEVSYIDWRNIFGAEKEREELAGLHVVVFDKIL